MIYLGSKDSFKQGVQRIIQKHFADDVAKRFQMEFEVNIFNPEGSQALRNQLKEEKYVLEVRFKTGDETSEYVCDLYSWDDKKNTEVRLLKAILSKYRQGKIKFSDLKEVVKN